jgi:hypothetical protein
MAMADTSGKCQLEHVSSVIGSFATRLGFGVAIKNLLPSTFSILPTGVPSDCTFGHESGFFANTGTIAARAKAQSFKIGAISPGF